MLEIPSLKLHFCMGPHRLSFTCRSRDQPSNNINLSWMPGHQIVRRSLARQILLRKEVPNCSLRSLHNLSPPPNLGRKRLKEFRRENLGCSTSCWCTKCRNGNHHNLWCSMDRSWYDWFSEDITFSYGSEASSLSRIIERQAVIIKYDSQ